MDQPHPPALLRLLIGGTSLTCTAWGGGFGAYWGGTNQIGGFCFGNINPPGSGYASATLTIADDDMSADLAVSVSEFPLVRKVFEGAPVRAMASIDRAEYIYIVARRDRGIENPSDLRGKRIGTAAGSIAEFYLGRFLSLQGMGMQDIHYVSVKTPPETSDAVVNGSLDAAVLAQPYADQAMDRLGENAVVWPAQSSQLLYALVVSNDSWIAGHPEQRGRAGRQTRAPSSIMAWL